MTTPVSLCDDPADLFLPVGSRNKCAISERLLTWSRMAYKGSLAQTVSMMLPFVGP